MYPTVVPENRSMVLLSAGDRVGDNSTVSWSVTRPDFSVMLLFHRIEQLLEVRFMMFLSMVTVCESTVNEMHHSSDTFSLFLSLSFFNLGSLV